MDKKQKTKRGKGKKSGERKNKRTTRTNAKRNQKKKRRNKTIESKSKKKPEGQRSKSSESIIPWKDKSDVKNSEWSLIGKDEGGKGTLCNGGQCR